MDRTARESSRPSMDSTMSVAIESKSVQRNLEDGGNLEDEISFQVGQKSAEKTADKSKTSNQRLLWFVPKGPKRTNYSRSARIQKYQMLCCSTVLVVMMIVFLVVIIAISSSVLQKMDEIDKNRKKYYKDIEQHLNYVEHQFTKIKDRLNKSRMKMMQIAFDRKNQGINGNQSNYTSTYRFLADIPWETDPGS
ncbi:uncharacterized protein LOC142342175 isoform X1 [Convolutriloba macropyga]|uniref:uncharacterized protein LOC142342175 isoform X1 n=1 Tax=Convolutriloba macropyga TaxID=536237 RepID=UPI003F51F5CC